MKPINTHKPSKMVMSFMFNARQKHPAITPKGNIIFNAVFIVKGFVFNGKKATSLRM